MTKPGYYSHEQLIEDTRQLAHLLETTHPDPYILGGGKIAFHRRLQRLLQAIPTEGLSKDEYVRLLRPFLAAVGEGHTQFWGGAYKVDEYQPGGVPLRFDVVGESLYVSAVPAEEQRDLLGSLLLSVEGVPLAELAERQTMWRGTENRYHQLSILSFEGLWYAPYLQDLLPEWEDTSRIDVALQLPAGEVRNMEFSLPVSTRRMISSESQLTLPANGCNPGWSNPPFAFDFVDVEQSTAYLCIARSQHFREKYEAAGKGAGYLSATEFLMSVTTDMKEAGTKTLIVDLRTNEGGSDLLSEILIYFLYGKEMLVSNRTRILRGGGYVRLVDGEYDFSGDFTGEPERFDALLQMIGDPAAFIGQDFQQRTPTFSAEYAVGDYEANYLPDNVLVLSSARTFSAGFAALRDLYWAGATLVGTPSSQAADAFGWGELRTLNHTGIQLHISSNYGLNSANDPEISHVLMPHYPMTYEKLVEYDFDPNATVLYALELVSKLEEQ